MSIERDTKFLGFARLQMPGLDSLFAVLYQAYATGDTTKRDEYSKRIETYLAQHAYGLVEYTLKIVNDSNNLMMGMFYAEDIPDPTECPDTSQTEGQ